MIAHLRKHRISQQKANLVAGMVRQKDVLEALQMLKFMPKKAAKILYKVLHSAAANAESNDGYKQEDLRIKTIIVNRGPYYKRFLPSARGRALPLRKPTSNITIELEQK